MKAAVFRAFCRFHRAFPRTAPPKNAPSAGRAADFLTNNSIFYLTFWDFTLNFISNY